MTAIIFSSWRSFSSLWDWSLQDLPKRAVAWLFIKIFLLKFFGWSLFSSHWEARLFSSYSRRCLSLQSCFWWIYCCCFSCPQIQSFCSFIHPYLHHRIHSYLRRNPGLNFRHRRLRFQFQFNRPKLNHRPNCSMD